MQVDKSWNIVPLILGALFVIVVGLAFLSTSAPAPEAEKTTTSAPKS